MKFVTLFLVFSMVVLMAEPGDAFFHHIIRGIVDACKTIHGQEQQEQALQQEQQEEQEQEQEEQQEQQEQKEQQESERHLFNRERAAFN
ncbi:moronecidin-like [Brachyistius frenatus]|uniref:moronecidin-like n=1 Tax=Brachyistius frenatus TaxID=100188 RepID=UPI0037E96343